MNRSGSTSRTSTVAVTVIDGVWTPFTEISNAAARDAASSDTTVNNAAFDKLTPVADMS